MVFFGLYLGASMGIDMFQGVQSGIDTLVIGPIVATIILFYTVRLAWVGVRVSDAGIKVRNPVRTHRIAWDDIKGFRWGRKGMLPKGLADLHDGRTVPLFGLPVTVIAPERSWGGKVVIRLNAHLEAVRAGRPWQEVPGVPRSWGTLLAESRWRITHQGATTSTDDLPPSLASQEAMPSKD